MKKFKFSNENLSEKKKVLSMFEGLSIRGGGNGEDETSRPCPE